MKRPGLASTMWFFTFVAASTLLFRQALGVNSNYKWDDDIIFAPNNFWDSDNAVVAISGTLTGDGVAYKNNTAVIACYKDRKECLVSSIEQIGHNQIGRVSYPSIYPITTWNAYQVIAVEDVAPWYCRKTTIILQRKRKLAVWVEEPINQTADVCKDSTTKVYKWTIEGPPARKAIMHK